MEAATFGVIPDGKPHNNVANLLDCFAQAAALGSHVVLPAGVIDTSEAVADTVVTADSGRKFRNNGGIPLPPATPMVIRGKGPESTVLRLSPGFPRAFDFWWESEAHHYRSITIRDLTVDRNSLTGLSLAPRQAISAWTNLARGTWTTLVGLNAKDFRNARLVWCPVENVGSAQGIALAARVEADEVQVRNDSDSTDFYLEPGDSVQGALRDHVIVGTQQFGGTVPHGWDMTIAGLRVENVRSINVATQTADGLSAPKSDASPNIFLNVQKVARAEAPSITDCVINGVRMNGGETGVCVSGSPGSFIDQCWFVDCFHDTMVDPPSNYVSANFMVGQDAWVATAGLIRCHGRRSGDVACELDQPWEGSEVDCIWEDAYNGVYSTTFVPPARTAAGPPTTTLTSDIAGGADAEEELTIVVDALPENVSPDGILQIDAELFWYRTAPGDGKTVAVLRGFNGTARERHPTGTRVVFVETDRTRFTSVRATIRNSVVMAAAGGGRAFLQYERNKLPLPPVSVQSASIQIHGGRFQPGQGVYWTGWQADMDIQSMRYQQHGIVGDSGTEGSVVSWSSSYAPGIEAANPPRRPMVRGGDNRLEVRGSEFSGSTFAAVKRGDEHTIVDLVVNADIRIVPA